MKCVSVTVGAPKIEVVNVTADKTTVRPGETVTITATIKNSGSLSGTANVDIFVNGTRQNLIKTVSLSPGQTTNVSWSMTFTEEGSYNICVEVV